MIDTFYDKVLNNGYSAHRIRLWEYQYILSRDHIVPLLEKNNYFSEGDNICEIGSAEGGVAQAFALKGANYCLCTDIMPHRLEIGKEMSALADLPIEYKQHNIITNPIDKEDKEKFDIAILRDVIEHLDTPEIALENIRKTLKENGLLYISFPPFYSPFGGHQQILKGGFITNLPYIHLLPKKTFYNFIKNGNKEGIKEVKRLKNIRFTAKKMVKIAKETGYQIEKEYFYLSRPVFKIRFGLPTIISSYLKYLPGFRSIFTTEMSLLLRKVK